MPAGNSIMIKRLLIAGILVALFLGGVAYFNLVFKPAMIFSRRSEVVRGSSR